MALDQSVLRSRLVELAPYPRGCVSFVGRPLMNGTAFFPGGDGVWKDRSASGSLDKTLDVLVLGSDFGDVVSYDSRFQVNNEWRDESDGRTWSGLLRLIDAAKIARGRIFYTNAWPCLREGDQPVKGGIPGARDKEFTKRCIAFFEATIDRVRPKLIVPLGVAPTRFVGHAAQNAWSAAHGWKQIDRIPVNDAFGARIVPVLHPSMPNRRYRTISFEREVELLRNSE